VRNWHQRSAREDRIRPLLQTAGGVVVVYAALSFGFFFAPSKATMGFVETAAQIIPVLLLVLALESRVFKLGPDATLPWRDLNRDQFLRRALRTSGVLGVLFGTISGEMAALQMISDNHLQTQGIRMVWGALYAGFTGVIVAGLSRPGQ
jgi:hypothetical protein